jgi:carbamoylphosphate synthase large subunit
MRVLLTGTGGPAGRSLAEQLRMRGHWVGGTDVREVPEGTDGFARVGAVTEDGYVPELVELVRRWDADAVIPTISEELVLLSQNRSSFPVPVLVGDVGPVSAADDKLRTARMLQAAGVPVPRTHLPTRFVSPEEAVVELGGAVIVKPRRSRGGRGVRLIRDNETQQAAIVAYWRSLDDDFIVQEFASGPEYAPVVFRERDSSFSACAVLRKTALKGGDIGNAVGTVRADGPDDADVRIAACAAMDALDLTGPGDVDVRRRADGTAVVLEVNARFGANSAVAPELADAALDALRRHVLDPADVPVLR